MALALADRRGPHLDVVEARDGSTVVHGGDKVLLLADDATLPAARAIIVGDGP